MTELDLPEVSSDTSSIGPQWPPRETSFNRVKGFYNKKVVETAGELTELLDEVEELVVTSAADRISVRMVLRNSLLSTERLDNWGEAVISLRGTQPQLEDTSMLYIGFNDKTRQPDSHDLGESLNNLDQALQRKQVSFLDMVHRLLDQGYELEMPDYEMRVKDGDFIDQLADLYSRFEWGKSDVEDILGNKNNLIMVARSGEEIVSAGIAEMSLIEFTEQDLSLRIVELTEAATRQEHANKGLYSGVSAALLRRLGDLSREDDVLGGKADIVFGECNGSSLGVLIAAKSQGRTFSLELAMEKNYPFSGILVQHVPIQGSERRTPYNDLFPAYLSRENLLSLSEK